MPRAQHLDHILKHWPFHPEQVNVRRVTGSDRRPLLQIRIEMGVLQLETSGRPDGNRPHGYESYLTYLEARERTEPEYTLTDEECLECDREFTQYFHRRMSWMALQEYDLTVADANHTLGLMDVCLRHAPSPEWGMSHERHRPFVYFQRTQAEALGCVKIEDAAAGVSAINRGVLHLRSMLDQLETGEDSEGDSLIESLVKLRESLRVHFKIGKTLEEQLAEAIASEQYELAARLRDQIQTNVAKPSC